MESADGSLNISAGSDFTGAVSGVQYRVKVENAENETVHAMNYTTMNFSIQGLTDGKYEVTIWTNNKYGESEGYTQVVTIIGATPPVSPSPSSSSTATPTKGDGSSKV